jgi:Zn-dependent protease/CBS domain-containing protein
MHPIRIGRIAGIDILVHWSWFGIFLLLTFWLATGFFADVYEDWSTTETWTVAVIAVLLFFGSILLHELSHSLVAKRLGLPVRDITLFIFGGVSALEKEPVSAKQEFQVAIAGPATSFILGALFLLIAASGYALSEENSPPFAVAEYLAVINIAVGIFNLLPGFPLDGGRVLRAALWARSRNMLTATRWASRAGTVIAFGLMAIGVVSILLGSFIGGVWFVVIGWFLRNASETSYQQLVFRTSLEGTKVGQIVNRGHASAPPDISLEQLVSEYLLGRSQRCVPIVVAGDLLGLITMSDLQRVPREQWAETSVYRAMTPRERLHIVTPETDLAEALAIMAANDVHQLPVVADREFQGFVTRADVLGLIQIRSELSGTGPDREEQKTRTEAGSPFP